MTLPLKLFVLVLLVICLAFAAWFVQHELRTPRNQRQTLDRMIELQKQGRYDKAVQVVQTWMNDSAHDVSHDGLLYEQIAMVLIAKAYKNSCTRQESVEQAERNLEKAIDLYNRGEPKGLQVELFEFGRGYEVLGDLSDRKKCQYYEKANQALLRQSSLIEGDSYTADGKTFRLDPLRADVSKHLQSISSKSGQANCPTFEKK